METEKVLDAATGTGASTGYLIEAHSPLGHEVFVTVDFTGGSASIEVSADGANFVPIEDGSLTASIGKMLDLAVGLYLRVAYTGVTTISATITPKYESNR